ncbi:purine-nucleoside phosphorylase [Pseudomonas asplenii]|uniref:purine-nucleoside phosphorylase n=1 Tax=Pseudomonas asplenii TaxID=53407 RepID=UPI0037CC90FF
MIATTRSSRAAGLHARSPVHGGFMSFDLPIKPKVVLIAMFAPEAQNWIERLALNHPVPLPGLSADYPNILCNDQGVCLLVTGMGQTNAAASTLALALSTQFDLRQSYFLIAGIAGINPHRGTLGTAAWARYLVDFGTQWALDSRDAPSDWPSGYIGVNTRGPDEKPRLDYRTELFELNPRLQARAYALTRHVALSESAESAAWRTKYPHAPANQPPQVICGDTAASCTWFSGTRLGERAEAWTRLLTDGEGIYCTTQQEDNSTYEALSRAARAGLLDIDRLAVVRAGSNFDRPYPGYSDADNLLNYAQQGGFEPALENLYRVGNTLVQEIVGNWAAWEQGIPEA